jgi:KipI family sensor histidine kinase inhibitor
VRSVGDHAVLLELPDNASVHATARVASSRFSGQLVEIVPGHCTLLLVGRAETSLSDLKTLASDASTFKSDRDAIADTGLAPLTVPVRYDGVDLEVVATALGLSREGVVQLHSRAVYTVAFMGFSPGFPYLVVEGRDEASRLLELSRLATPRIDVPVGAVAVAAGYCGIYPRSSPGGWNLLGRTDVVLFDPERKAPALLEPGARVRFEAF